MCLKNNRSLCWQYNPPLAGEPGEGCYVFYWVITLANKKSSFTTCSGQGSSSGLRIFGIITSAIDCFCPVSHQEWRSLVEMFPALVVS